MSQEPLIKIVADQIAVLAEEQGRTPKAVLEDVSRYLLQQRLRNLISTNRAEAEARGYSPSDVDEWIDEDRREQRIR